jgi:hypothetical protein
MRADADSGGIMVGSATCVARIMSLSESCPCMTRTRTQLALSRFCYFLLLSNRLYEIGLGELRCCTSPCSYKPVGLG